MGRAPWSRVSTKPELRLYVFCLRHPTPPLATTSDKMAGLWSTVFLELYIKRFYLSMRRPDAAWEKKEMHPAADTMCIVPG